MAYEANKLGFPLVISLLEIPESLYEATVDTMNLIRQEEATSTIMHMKKEDLQRRLPPGVSSIVG